jgi:mono/diheme cytochrome c family protein
MPAGMSAATFCIACHQANGRGPDRGAPPLLVGGLALGDPGSPVAPAIVTEVGPKRAGRTSPWTNEELTRIGGRH